MICSSVNRLENGLVKIEGVSGEQVMRPDGKAPFSSARVTMIGAVDAWDIAP
jgi:hypothetical protein